MKRYFEMVCEAYVAEGFIVEKVIAPSVLSRQVASRRLGELLSYLERYLFVPIMVMRKRNRHDFLIHITDHSNALLCLLLPGKKIVTCHDVFAIRAARREIPGVSIGRLGRLLQALNLLGLRKALLVIAVSKATAFDVKMLDIKRCEVNHSTVEDVFGNASEVRQENFVLCVSTQSWRKRREYAVEAWKVLRKSEVYMGCRLIIVGPPLSVPELAALSVDDRENVSTVSGLSDQELRDLYSRARLAVVQSPMEGFGWPLVEAQLALTPVLAFDAVVLREVGGDGAVYADLSRIQYFGQAEIKTLAEELSRPSLVELGSRNARRFNKARFQERTGKLARDVLSI